ncbi:predicted protein [Nematostella vectensis]|uniref:Amino acid transporter transmembrane domain-containing protein n=1 Tax=Nematostella vectensis TaxID=45351 RepID=A7RXM9_NEMVE|nr:predicted protein [Nematostella vectensis]|eukprot:XP_001635866.1 predicted protein [Nematostella vectensis]
MAKCYSEQDYQLGISSSVEEPSLHISYEMINHSLAEPIVVTPRSTKAINDDESERTSLLSTRSRGELSQSSPWASAGYSRVRSLTFSMNRSLIEKESPDRRASALLAGWNVTNLIQGMGILGIPYAVREGGIAAAVCIFVVAIVCDVTGILLVDCLYEISPRSQKKKRIRSNYPEVGEAVWPGIGGKVVSVVQTIELYTAAMLYLILLTTMFSQITEKYISLSMNVWAVLCAVAVLPSVFITRLSLIAWMSMIAVLALMSSIAVTLAYCILNYDRWSINNIPTFDGNTFPIGFGIVTFSYCAHAVFPGIEASMKHPENYNKMMHTSFLVSATVKTLFGAFAVLTFGLVTDQVVTVNLADSLAFNTAATAFVALNVFFSFPLPLFVVIETFDGLLLPHFPYVGRESNYHWVWLLITRTLLVTFALFISLIVPHFGLLMGFIGSFTGTCLSFCFPCIAHLKLKWKYLRWYQILGELVLIVFGVVAGVFGFIYSGKALIDSFKQNPPSQT